MCTYVTSGGGRWKLNHSLRRAFFGNEAIKEEPNLTAIREKVLLSAQVLWPPLMSSSEGRKGTIFPRKWLWEGKNTFLMSTFCLKVTCLVPVLKVCPFLDYRRGKALQDFRICIKHTILAF